MNRFSASNSTEYVNRIMTECGEFGNRIAYTRPDIEAKKYIIKEMYKLGLDVKIDAVGNIFGIRHGKNSSCPGIQMGSHIDSVPNGGNYDGLAGIALSLAAVKSLNDKQVETDRDVVVCAFATEESSVFGNSCIGSKFLCGDITEDDLRNIKVQRPSPDYGGAENLLDVANNCLSEFEIVPRLGKDDIKWGEFYEPHIEQGEMLLEKGIDVGIATSIAAPTRASIEIKNPNGPQHSGTTPTNLKKDVGDFGYEIKHILQEKAAATDDKVRCNAVIIPKNPSINAITGEISLPCEARSFDIQLRDEVFGSFLQETEEILQKSGFEYKIEHTERGIPTILNNEMIEIVEKNSKEFLAMQMMSGAGHDAAYINKICAKGAMVLFAPHPGPSHCPHESCDLEKMIKLEKILTNILLDRGIVKDISQMKQGLNVRQTLNL